jgi:hypothetical protein
MVAFNPKERLTMKQLLAHEWLQKEKRPIAFIKADFDKRKATVEQEAHDAREEKRVKRKKRGDAKDAKVNRGDLHVDLEEAKEHRKTKFDEWKELEIRNYADQTYPTQTQFFTKVTDILTCFEEINDYIDATDMKGEFDLKEKAEPYHHHAQYPKKINSSYLKVRYECDVIPDEEEEEDEEETKAETKEKITLGINVEILACKDKNHCVDFSLKEYKVNGVV